jgi:hypothetical protein
MLWASTGSLLRPWPVANTRARADSFAGASCGVPKRCHGGELNSYAARSYSVISPPRHGMPAETLTYGYDTLGAAATLTGAVPYVTTTAYTRLGQLARRVYGNTGPGQLTRDSAWDEATGRLQTITGKIPDPAQPGRLCCVESSIRSATARTAVGASRLGSRRQPWR